MKPEKPFSYQYLQKGPSIQILFNLQLAVLGVIIALLTAVLISHREGSWYILLSTALVLSLTMLFMLFLSKNRFRRKNRTMRDMLLPFRNHHAPVKRTLTSGKEADLLMHELEQSLQKLDEELLEKKYFAGLLSHDLRSPLSSMILVLSLIKNQKNLQETGKYIDMLESSARKELEMLKDLLMLMRIDDLLARDYQKINIKELIGQLIPGFEDSITAKELQVKTLIPADIGLETSRDALRLVLLNLIRNAIYYSPPKGVIKIMAWQTDGQLGIEVSDKGQGFEPGAAGELFSYDNLLIKNRPGESETGIGLYFSRKIIRNLGGSLEAESLGPGTGARFIVKLPLEHHA